MGKFIVEPHFRLQEWVAEEKGYFRAEGLDYEFRELIRSTEGQHHNKVNEGAFQSIEKGRKADQQERETSQYEGHKPSKPGIGVTI